MKEPLGVIGAGWVGLVTAACFADLGHEVVVRDVVPERIAELEAGRVPIFEPGLAELLAANRERIRYTLDMADVFERCTDGVRVRRHASYPFRRCRPLPLSEAWSRSCPTSGERIVSS